MAEIPASSAKMTDTEIAQGAAHSKTLMTKFGANINFLLETILPVGAYIETHLTPDQFYTQGYSSSRWVLADGRNVSGSLYHSVTGNVNIPDRRGRFARMKDHGAGLNPDGDLALGATQTDQNKEHDHTLSSDGFHTHGGATGAGGEHNHLTFSSGAHTHRVMVDNDIFSSTESSGPSLETENTNRTYALGDPVPNSFIEEAGSHQHTVQPASDHTHTISAEPDHTHTVSTEGGNEARPKSITVNVFIRIN